MLVSPAVSDLAGNALSNIIGDRISRFKAHISKADFSRPRIHYDHFDSQLRSELSNEHFDTSRCSQYFQEYFMELHEHLPTAASYQGFEVSPPPSPHFHRFLNES